MFYLNLNFNNNFLKIEDGAHQVWRKLPMTHIELLQ